MGNWPLPAATCAALNDEPGRRKSGNPGLVLDRLVDYPSASFDEFKQTHQKPHLEVVCASMAANVQSLNELLPAWDSLVAAAGEGARQFRLATVWRMAMHLSRATAVENASLCLHPVYGFPYLPGTGLKGLAKTWADLYGPGNNSDDFKRVFGTQGGTGSVVFLEAWPEQITDATIEIDIVNNHHREYYGSHGGTPPGDWESPIPVYFLAVASDIKFRFAVAKARPATPDADLVNAQEWLERGLTELGFGAKTAAGYGYFDASSSGVSSSAAAQSGEEGLLQQFQSRHQKLAAQPNRSDVGNAVTELERMDQGEPRSGLAKWAYEHLERCNMLTESTNKNPKPYGDRLAALSSERD